MKEEIQYLSKQGKRLDGRKVDELRPISIQTNVLHNAEGSAYIEWGQNKALVGVYGPREALPQHIQDPTKALVNFVYRMATFSVPDKKMPKPGRREIEISKVLGEALERAIFLEKFPNTTIDIYAYIFDSNAGTRITALTAAAVAVADAGIPMRDLVSGVAVGRAGGQLMLDLTKEEEDAPDAVDIPVAILPNSEEIVLLQMDGLMKKEEMKKALEMGLQGCKQVYDLQKQSLKERYALEDQEEAPAEEERMEAQEADFE